MISKKRYIKPEVIRILLDKSITLMMKSHPKPPHPRRPGGGKGIDNKGLDEPAFNSPFGDKPFS
jgi:hypothetical protein